MLYIRDRHLLCERQVAKWRGVCLWKGKRICLEMQYIRRTGRKAIHSTFSFLRTQHRNRHTAPSEAASLVLPNAPLNAAVHLYTAARPAGFEVRLWQLHPLVFTRNTATTFFGISSYI